MFNKKLNLDELKQVLETAAKFNVSELEIGDLKISFRLPVIQTKSVPVLPVKTEFSPEELGLPRDPNEVVSEENLPSLEDLMVPVFKPTSVKTEKPKDEELEKDEELNKAIFDPELEDMVEKME